MTARGFFEGIVRHRLAVLAVLGAFTAVAGWSASRVTFDSDIEIWFLEDDENLVTYRGFLDRFGADELTVIGIFADDVFTPERLAALKTLTTRIEDEVPFVVRARSLANIELVRGTPEGDIAIQPLMDALPKTDAEAAAFRELALGNVLVKDNLVSPTGDATAIVVEIDPEQNDFQRKVEFVQGLRRVTAESMPPDIEYHIAGSPPLDEAFFVYTERDFSALGPAAFAVVVLATLIIFRRLSAAVVPLSVVGISLIWLFGLMGALGLKINLVSSSLVALILGVGVADSIHVLTDYYQSLASGLRREQAVVHACESLLLPCFFTSATTAVGFLSLLSSSLAPIREFGWLSALGVFFAFGLTMTFIPCVLGLARPPDEGFVERQRNGPLARLIRWLGGGDLARARRVLAATAVLVVLAGIALTRLSTDANPMNYFLPGDPIRVSMQKVDQKLAGSSSFEFLVETPPGGLKDPKVLAALDGFSERVAELPAISRVLSVLDSLRETRRVLTDGESDALPGADDHPGLAAQLYLILEGDEDFGTMVTGDYDAARLTARVRLSEADQLTRETHRVDAWIRDEFDTDALRIRPTGFVKLMSDMEHYLFQSQVRSLGIAFTAITLMMFLLLRSVWLGIFSMIPNLVPIAFGIAFMAAAGIALDPGTVMIGSIALGLVVDDTVHFLVRLRRALADGCDLAEAIDRTMHRAGRAIVLTSVILAGGFGTLALGSFSPNVAFGMVSAVVILMALVADLVILPAALRVVRPRITIAPADAQRD